MHLTHTVQTFFKVLRNHMTVVMFVWYSILLLVVCGVVMSSIYWYSAFYRVLYTTQGGVHNTVSHTHIIPRARLQQVLERHIAQ